MKMAPVVEEISRETPLECIVGSTRSAANLDNKHF